MTEKQFSMAPTQIAKVVGTVASPLIVVSELLKNAVDASAKNIKICYDLEHNIIAVENDHNGFSIEEIEALSTPGTSSKKVENYLENEYGMFLTGSKGLGLLSVFSLCDEAEILTTLSDQKIYKIILKKLKGTVEYNETDQQFEKHFTQVVLKNVNPETIDYLSSETEVRKLRHICTTLYKGQDVPFPKIQLQISGQKAREINLSCTFPPMLYDVRFCFQKDSGELRFQCNSPSKPINSDNIVLKNFDKKSLQETMLNYYGIKDTILTRANKPDSSIPKNFNEVPSFEGRVLVYETGSGAQLRTYGAGVNVYVNDFALYYYLAEENDWLGLADFSQRKKSTRLKPHNVFGYVNFPGFNENSESLRISNERADFIQDLTYSRLMYLLKGVVMFIIFNIDVADKNPKYKASSHPDPSKSGDNIPNSGDIATTADTGTAKERNSCSDSEVKIEQENLGTELSKDVEIDTNAYSPENIYKPKRNVQKHLTFTEDEGQIINKLKDSNNLCNKIYNVVFELSRLDLQVHRYSIACLYRTLIESSTKYLSQNQSAVTFDNNRSLEESVLSALIYFGNNSKKSVLLSPKKIRMWRDTVSKRKLIDSLNEYIHNETPVDAYLLQESWNTMKGYIIACLTISDRDSK